MKSKAISRKGKEFNIVRQRKNKEAIPFRGTKLSSFRLKKEGNVFSDDYSYAVPRQMDI